MSAPASAELVLDRPPVESVQSEQAFTALNRTVATVALNQTAERPKLAAHERPLTEVDNLNRLRNADGTHDQRVLDAILINLVPRVKEPAMPYARSRTYQEWRDGAFWWLDETSQDVAASGRRYHEHPAALARVDVEEDEALDLDQNLRPGYVRVFYSPKMSSKDAPHDVAKAEHLADDDMIRIHCLDASGGEVRGKWMESILIRDVPLRAWVRMLADPNNIFGRTVRVADPESALSVMQASVGLEVPEAALPEGVVTLLEKAIPYIDDAKARSKVARHLEQFRLNQQSMHEVAEAAAREWLGFEVSLADSLHAEESTPLIEKFIDDLAEQWTDEDLTMFAVHRLRTGRLYMTRKLALRLEEAKQNVLWAEAAVAIDNRRVTKQMNAEVLARIHANQAAIQHMQQNGGDPRRVAELRTQNAQLIAGENVTVGGGCPGESSGKFREKQKQENKKEGEAKKKADKDKGGKKREWMYCVHCPLCERDGVDAYIDYLPEKNMKRITCCSCNGHKEYEHKGST